MLRRYGRTVAMLLLFSAAPVAAEPHTGVRAGASADPNQFFFGGHADTAPLAEHLTFRPNAEIGVGDGTTLIALNLEFAYWMPLRRNPWAVYLGAGPAANIFAHRRGTLSDSGDTRLGGGFNILVGTEHRQGLFVELKVGVIDSPTLKVTVGRTFK